VQIDDEHGSGTTVKENNDDGWSSDRLRGALVREEAK
jgi:hypothetical protein